MRFGILGPLWVADGAKELAITAGRDRVVLAMLLLRAGHVVGVDELLDALWESGPPATARGQLQNCVSRLRRLLPAGTITTDPAGYGIRVAPEELDAAVFARLTARAREQMADAPDEGRRLFRQALDLWRGPALTGIDSRPVRRRAAVLDEQQAVATEDWVDLELAAGRDRDLLAELAGLVERFPLRERLRAQLMLTLYRAGRQADALAEYRRARAVLLDELGIEPGAALQDMHRRILSGETTGSAPVRRAGVALRSLPRTVGDFTGRAETVQRLVGEIAGSTGDAPLIKVIDGMAGSGKTTLALHVANMVTDGYPDAQLFVDLHGHSDRRPLEPAAALVVLLRQLGVQADRIPGDPDGRVALWRSELATRRVLVVLDNAASTAQVGPLLPASPGCLALVTSRRRLAGLDGVRPESIPLLTEDEGVELLSRIVADRVAAEPDAAREVVRRCGRLPLAIRLAGSRLAHRQRWRVADLVRRLGEHGTALPELAAEDRSVVSAFALSYGQLAGSQQRMFRLLGLHPGTDFDATAMAALVDLPLDDAEDLLDDLVDMHLVEEPEPSRFRLHDLMREYAATLVDGDPAQVRDAAVIRLVDLHLHVAARAAEALGVRDGTPGEPARPDLVDAVPDPQGWLDRERATLPRLAGAAVAAGRPEYAWLLADTTFRFFDVRGYTDDIVEMHRRAESAARAAGDHKALADMLMLVASAHYKHSRIPEALALVRESAQLYRALGDHRSEVSALGNLSSLHESVGELRKALDTSQRALHLRRRMGNDLGIVRRLIGLAIPYLQLGEFATAQRYLRPALQLAAETGEDAATVQALTRLGLARIGLDRLDMADRLLTAALRLSDRRNYRIGRAEALTGLGRVAHARGDHRAAVALHEQALAVSTELGEPRGRALGLNDLGAALAGCGREAEAAAAFRQAAELAASVHHPYEQARAMDGLAGLLLAADPVESQRLWQRALVIYARMGVPVGTAVRTRLAELRGRLQEAAR